MSYLTLQSDYLTALDGEDAVLDQVKEVELKYHKNKNCGAELMA